MIRNYSTFYLSKIRAIGHDRWIDDAMPSMFLFRDVLSHRDTPKSSILVWYLHDKPTIGDSPFMATAIW